MINEAGLTARRNPAPVYTFTIQRKNGNYEEVNSCFIEFTANHVIFRDEDGNIDYGIHASEVVDITSAEADK